MENEKIENVVETTEAAVAETTKGSKKVAFAVGGAVALVAAGVATFFGIKKRKAKKAAKETVEETTKENSEEKASE
jgi:flagellar basal body-associated protein FliL